MLSLMSGSRLELFARGAEIARASRLLSHHEKSPAVRRGLEACYLPRRGSFRPPTAFCTFPAALFDLPSGSSLASPVTLPATSLMAPLACFAEPSIRSLSMSMPFDGVRAPSTPGRASKFISAAHVAGTRAHIFVSRERAAWAAKNHGVPDLG